MPIETSFARYPCKRVKEGGILAARGAASQCSLRVHKTAKGHTESLGHHSAILVPGDCTPQALVAFLTLILPRTGVLTFSFSNLLLLLRMRRRKRISSSKVFSIILKIYRVSASGCANLQFKWKLGRDKI